ncbi:hypothetical protein F5Y08DRAFT_284772 [Xylaria arbuscula]|nr:hypothetical protein F5Y08DRAFT_284772 [Xylaria arbuscula]
MNGWLRLFSLSTLFSNPHFVVSFFLTKRKKKNSVIPQKSTMPIPPLYLVVVHHHYRETMSPSHVDGKAMSAL